jgi:hyperosmotically inducible periplasmic protein
MSNFKRVRLFLLAAVIACTGLSGISGAARAQDKPRTSSNAAANLQREVYHQLVLLPRLTLFDNLQFQVNGDSVILTGQVTNPTLKDDAKKAVKGIEGVSSVTDNIEVLPVSPDDVQIRRAEYRAIYGFPGLELYATGSQQPIHIIVKNGHVTLIGTVSNEMDKTIVQHQALSVPSVFGVDNQLKIQSGT